MRFDTTPNRRTHRWARWAWTVVLLHAAAAAGAVNLQLSKQTDVSPTSQVGSFSASLNEGAGGAELQLINASGGSARITRIFIQDIDPVLVQGPAGVAPPITLSGAFTEGLSFDVRLDSGGANKLAVVKVVKDFTGLGLKEAKDLVDQAPALVARGLPQDQADALRQALVEAGASVSALPLDAGIGMQLNLPFKQVVSAYDVVLSNGGANKLAVVKIVKDMTGLGLKEAKDLVDSAPAVVLHNADAAVAGDLQRQLVDAGASALLDAISQTVSHPIGLPGASQALVASVEVLLDYKGHSGNPDLLLGLPVNGSFADLLGSAASQRFRLGLEITDATGADLYLLAPVPEPETWLMWLAGVLAIGSRRRAIGRRSTASSTGTARPALHAG